MSIWAGSISIRFHVLDQRHARDAGVPQDAHARVAQVDQDRKAVFGQQGFLGKAFDGVGGTDHQVGAVVYQDGDRDVGCGAKSSIGGMVSPP